MASYLPFPTKTSSELSSIGYLPVVYELDCAVEIHKLREPVVIIAATYDGESSVRCGVFLTSPVHYIRQAVVQGKKILRVLDQ